MFHLIKELTGLAGPCGHEQNVSKYIRDKVSSLSDDVQVPFSFI
ncbi:hypothetical protein [Fictibacillus marinisediminis]|nr:hypothetical protein [Fictibacillus marinisediminis]